MANIKNYKLLDITELSGSSWSTAEKVLGLDENDKVVMAQPEESVTPEYVETAIDEAIASETARTEEAYAKKSELPDMDDYYTKSEVDEAIANVDVSDQLVNYALTSSVTQDIQTAIASETARTEETYAKKSELPDMNNYYTKAQVDAEITGATEGMATETWVQNQGYLTEHQDLSAYAKTTAVTQDIQTAIAAETGRTEETYAKISDIPSLSDYYTKAQVDAEITGATEGLATEAYVTAATANLASTGYVDASITAATATETARTESTYAKIGDIPSLTDYSTTDEMNAAITAATASTTGWVESQGYLTEHQDLSDYALTTAVTQDINTAIAAETARTEETYAKPSQIPSLAGYWTSAQTEAAITAATDGLATEGYVDSSITAATASETARTESTYAKIGDVPSLAGYWTSAETQNAITAATDDMATKTWVGEQGYLTQHQDISGKLDVSVFTGYTGTTETELAGKVDTSAYTAYTASTDTALSGKQETLVSGTNIKTINNESILGSGNITIQGGGGGGGNVVELTQAQYEALDPPAQDTTYIITDADTVDLNDYAMASGLTELSGTVATINSNYATKQSVTARASNSNYLPGWNAQGVITGSTAYYIKSQGINGTNYSVFTNSSTNHPAIFAPTSAGTAGQPLLSNGSGAPVWGGYKFAFITQTEYDALTTPDATTIYFIIGD